MASWLRSLLITSIVTVFSFLTLTAWYAMNFKEPASEKIHLLRQVMPAIEQLLEVHDDIQAAALLDKVPFKVVVTDEAKQVISSNTAKTPRQRREFGLQLLKNQGLQKFLVTPEGYLRFYYQEPFDLWDMHLLFLLFFGILLGLIAALWDYLQRIHLQDQTDTLVLLSQTQHSDTDEELQEEIEALEAELTRLKAQLDKATSESSQRESQYKNEQAFSELRVVLSKEQNKYQSAQNTIAGLEQSLDILKAEARTWHAQEQTRAENTQQLEDEITQLHQEQQRLIRDLEQAKKRLERGEQDSTQLHETWQEIERLRHEQNELLKREESWQKEKQRVLALMHEKEEQVQAINKRLTSARQKIRELSVAYKKILESNLNLPDDLIQVKEILDGLIEEKDLVEQENANLQIDLADKESEIKRLRTELGIRAKRLEQATKMIEELSQNLQKNERELGLLSDTLEDKMHDLERVKSLHEDDQMVLEELIQERDTLRIRLTDYESKIEDLMVSKGKLLFEKEQLEEQLEAQDLPAYELEIAQLKQSLNLMGLQQQRRNQTLESLKTKLKEGEELYNRLKRHAEGQEKQIRNLHQDLERQRSEMNLIEKKLDAKN